MPNLSHISSWINKHHKQTLLGRALADSSTDDWALLQKSELDQAKKISDFVGFLMRIGFVYLAMLFFHPALANLKRGLSNGRLVYAVYLPW
jgi:hypothetical protein